MNPPISVHLPAGRPFAVAARLLGVALSASATASTFVFDYANLDTPIPDGSSSGVAVTRQITLPAAPIVKVSVFLGVLPRDGAAMFNGDLYVGLSHGDEYAVLVNRVGRRAGSGLGYGDSGFEVWLDDAATQGDLHAYRLELGGSHAPGSLPSGTPLTGIWAPDGRSVNPATVLLTDTRQALLNVFNGRDANGDWTLFLADWESGGLAKLDRWSLHVTTVPEPALTGALTGLGLVALGLLRRWRT